MDKIKRKAVTAQIIAWLGAMVAIEILVIVPVSRPGGLMPLIVLLLLGTLSIRVQKWSLEPSTQRETAAKES